MILMRDFRIYILTNYLPVYRLQNSFNAYIDIKTEKIKFFFLENLEDVLRMARKLD